MLKKRDSFMHQRSLRGTCGKKEKRPAKTLLTVLLKMTAAPSDVPHHISLSFCSLLLFRNFVLPGLSKNIFASSASSSNIFVKAAAVQGCFFSAQYKAMMQKKRQESPLHVSRALFSGLLKQQLKFSVKL